MNCLIVVDETDLKVLTKHSVPENSTALNDAHLKMKLLVVFCPFFCVCVCVFAD